MGWFNVYGSFRQIIQDLVAPSLEAIQGQLEAINAAVNFRSFVWTFVKNGSSHSRFTSGSLRSKQSSK